MNQSGQMMLVALLLGVLLLITVSLVVFVNQIGTFHQTASTQRSAARTVAQEGIAYALTILSANAATWQNALTNTQFPADCNSGSDVTSSSGGRFQLQCSVDFWNPNLQPYEVIVTATAMSPAGQGPETPLRALQAYVSPRTLGVDLTGNVHAGAAVQMVTQPIISGALNVHWGPLVCLDSNPTPWTLLTPLDDMRYPRKFSQGGITGAAFPRSGSALGSGPATDQKEYWAYASQSIPPFIDESAYQALASSTDITTPPISKNSGAHRYPILTTACGAAHSQCAYFQPDSGDTALFDAGFSAPASGVIYVNGNAEFDDVAFVDSITFIVTGNLTITPAAASGGALLNLHVPITAPSEYPYAPATPASWPCSDKAGSNTNSVPNYDCTSDTVFSANSGFVQFWGFLYVKDNLTVQASNWNMVGSLLVGDMQRPGGQILIGTTAALNVAYDDVVNHAILVQPVYGTAIRLAPDLLQDVSTH